MKCHEKITINEVVKKIKDSLEVTNKNCSCRRGYQYLVIDTNNMGQKLELRYLLDKIGPLYASMESDVVSGTIHDLNILVFWIQKNPLNQPEQLREGVESANIGFFERPINANELKTIFFSERLST